jgi:hypothetical protein
MAKCQLGALNQNQNAVSNPTAIYHTLSDMAKMGSKSPFATVVFVPQNVSALVERLRNLAPVRIWGFHICRQFYERFVRHPLPNEEISKLCTSSDDAAPISDIVGYDFVMPIMTCAHQALIDTDGFIQSRQYVSFDLLAVFLS